MSKKEENISFEDAITQLEKIANELENGNLSLDESVSKFEDGMKLSKKCNEILDNAEKKITILLQDEENIKEENFLQDDDTIKS